MHNCEEFRERMAEHIIDRQDLTNDPRFKPELLFCPDCCGFYVESCEAMNALSSVDTHVDAYVGAGFSPAFKYKQKLYIMEFERERRARSYRRVLQWSAAAAALLLVTAGLSRLPAPAPDSSLPRMVNIEQPVPLDPGTVDFLQQSELLLRNVVNMAPNNTQDLADVKRIAGEQLLAINQRKDAAAQLPPVLNVMDTYETVLRDIRNVDEKSASDDVPDIQNRIQRDGLIANIKAFQPRVTTVSFRPQ
jgi:hypothetical protein